MHNNGLKTSGALEVFISIYDFWVQKCKKQLFEEVKRFYCSFYQIKVQVITNPSSRLEKTPNTWIFAYDRFFKICFKKLIFHIFRYFRKSSAAHTKIIVCVLFHVNMFDEAQCSLISPFYNGNFSRLCPLPVLT